MEIREIRPEEVEPLGEITVEAYMALQSGVVEGGYDVELRDVAGRLAAGALVLVAVDDDGTLLGGVTYVGDSTSPLAEHRVPDAATIRMLAVAVAAQRRGAGDALTVACIDQATREGKAQIVLHSTRWMTVAHRLYARHGFVRDETLDWRPMPDLLLMGFRLRLR
jgi:ribosomal protein S18 acetylase RimI-like enzyme